MSDPDPLTEPRDATEAAAPLDAFSQPPSRVPPEPARAVKRSGGSGGTILLALAAVVAIGGVAFAGGRLTAPASPATTTPVGPGGGQGFGGQFGGQGRPGGQGGQGGQFGGGGFGGFAGGLRGSVTAVGAAGITIQLANGTTLTVPLDGDTTYHRAATAGATDVAIGTEVQITPGTISRNPAATPGTGGQGFGAQLGPAVDVLIVGD